MPDISVNRLSCTIGNAPGSAGNITVAAARAGFRSFGSVHNGLSFTVLIEEGTAWEVRNGCVYTHAGTTLTRGTLEDSSTGSAVSFSIAAVVTVTLSAQTVAILSAVAGGFALTLPDGSVKSLAVVDLSGGVSAPVTDPGGAPGSAGVLTGTYYYKATFVTAQGETDSPTSIPVVTTVSGQQINVSSIPLGGAGVTARKLYRTRNTSASGEGVDPRDYFLVTTIANNTATTYTDNTPDGSLGAVVPSVNTAVPHMSRNGVRVGSFIGNSVGFGNGAFATGTGYACSAFGFNALNVNTSGRRNVGFGTYALTSNTSGNRNTAMGVHALNYSTSASDNTAFGYAAAFAFNVAAPTRPITAIGANALYNLVSTSGGSTAVGAQAGELATTSFNLTLVGDFAGRNITTGSAHVIIGTQTALGLSTGNFNTIIGSSAYSSGNGGNNTVLGYNALSGGAGNSNIALGWQAGLYATGSDELWLDSRDRTNLAGQQSLSLVWGTMAATAEAQRIRFNATVKTLTTTAANLPAVTGLAGHRAFVTDANSTTFASIVAGGGSNGVPVYCDGTNWRIG